MAIMTLPPLYLGDITRFNLIHSGRDVDPDGVDPDPTLESKNWSRLDHGTYMRWNMLRTHEGE